jgi:predicted nucleic acid-binding protein
VNTWLLDGNVLVALADASHVHHVPAEDWLAAQTAPFVTCPITQGTLLRTLLSTGAVASAHEAADILVYAPLRRH